MNPVPDKRIKIGKRGFKAKREAQSELSRLRYEYDQGVVQTADATSYQAIYDKWIAFYQTTVASFMLNKTLQYFLICDLFLKPLRILDYARYLSKFCCLTI